MKKECVLLCIIWILLDNFKEGNFEMKWLLCFFGVGID